MSLLDLVTKLVASNQNMHRLDKLCDFEHLPVKMQAVVERLLGSKGDRAHQAAGVFIWAAITHGKPTLVLSSRDLDALIVGAAGRIPEGVFTVKSIRKGGMTIYGQFTGFMVNHGFFRIVLPQKGKKPSVVEITYPDILEFLEPANEEFTEQVIKSVDNTTKQQDSNTTILQLYNTTSKSAPQDAPQNAPQEKPFFGKRKE